MDFNIISDHLKVELETVVRSLADRPHAKLPKLLKSEETVPTLVFMTPSREVN